MGRAQVTWVLLFAGAAGCFDDHARVDLEDAGRDAGRDAGSDAGASTTCAELFARTPDEVRPDRYVDETCTPTTFPLALTFLEGPGALDTCFRVRETPPGTGWSVGDLVAAGGPGTAIRVASSLGDPARIVWDARGLDASGRLLQTRAETVLIERAPIVRFETTVLVLGSLTPPIWASPGEIHVGTTRYPVARGETTLQTEPFGAAYIEPSPTGSTFHWIGPDEVDHPLALRFGATTRFAGFLGLDGEPHWMIVEGTQAMEIAFVVDRLQEVTAFGVPAGVSAIAATEDALYVQVADRVHRLDRRGATIEVLEGVRALLPHGLVTLAGRVTSFSGAVFEVAPEDLDAAGTLVDVLNEDLVVGTEGVVAWPFVAGPTFVPWTQLGQPVLAVHAGPQYVDVLLVGQTTAMRLELSFRGCD